jgi:hypothetical protein
MFNLNFQAAVRAENKPEAGWDGGACPASTTALANAVVSVSFQRSRNSAQSLQRPTELIQAGFGKAQRM